ncbi:hypothetical protein E3N88_00505 [Mikania micrantha]|uniref:Uncharacterized protein n=1 Tax=Mikania micrantha TaxID=192012 RepID=A0A5N6PYB1_9ASTR|nr:hypothetical protein E3N88_00505 [Mikania micrantha]
MIAGNICMQLKIAIRPKFLQGRKLKARGLEISETTLNPNSTNIHHRIQVWKKANKFLRRVYDIKGSVKCSNASDSTHVPLIEWSLSVFACWGSWFAASPAFLDAARAWPVEATVCLAMAPAVALIVLLWLCPWLAGYAPGLLYDAWPLPLIYLLLGHLAGLFERPNF